MSKTTPAPNSSGHQAPAEPARPEPWKRVKIRAYKVSTSQGRMIEGQICELPGPEADKLVSEKQASHADP